LTALVLLVLYFQVFKSISECVFLVLVASKRIRHNQIKTDKVGVLKNHAPIVGCRNEQQFE
jgi:hypothetical protein